jgi:hypothetical protein
MDSKKQTPEKSPEAPVIQKTLKNGAILLLVMASVVGGIALIGLLDKTEKKKDTHTIRPAEYYSLVFHTHQMGNAVYQATGDGKNCPPKGCIPNPQPLHDWMSESVVLAGQMAGAKGISDQCREAANKTRDNLAVLQDNLKKDTPYQSGYQAWKDINALLLTCD